MASAVAHSARTLSFRTVHIKIHPTPRSFNERREVLRVLERFGEVALFRSYKYHSKTPVHNAFLSVFATNEAATKIKDASPIRYRLLMSPESPDPQTPPNPEDHSNPTSKGPLTLERTFELQITSSKHDHTKAITNGPLYGPYDPDLVHNSFISSVLERIIPPSMWSAGLADWDTDPMRHRSELGQGAMSNSLQVDARGRKLSSTVKLNGAKGFAERERKRREKRVPRVMGGLLSLVKRREARKETEKAKTMHDEDEEDVKVPLRNLQQSPVQHL